MVFRPSGALVNSTCFIKQMRTLAIELRFVALALVALALVSLAVHPARVSSDSASYIAAITVLRTGVAPDGFVPNRILTTFLGLEKVRVLGAITGNLLSGWMLMNMLAYVFGFLFWYALLREFFESRTVAIMGTLLLAGNYTSLAFGLNYLMDMSGWATYLIALWSAFRYVTTNDPRYLWLGSVASGVGGLYKEYGFLGLIPIGIVLLREYRTAPARTLGRLVRVTAIGLTPLLISWIYVYYAYGYTYLDWFRFNTAQYAVSYAKQVVEYIKVFGSLFTFGWFLALPGIYLLLRRAWAEYTLAVRAFVLGFFFSALPVFVWPAITQRIYFVPVAFLSFTACVFLKRHERYLAYLLPLLALYLLVSLFMDQYILPKVNIGSFFSVS